MNKDLEKYIKENYEKKPSFILSIFKKKKGKEDKKSKRNGVGSRLFTLFDENYEDGGFVLRSVVVRDRYDEDSNTYYAVNDDEELNYNTSLSKKERSASSEFDNYIENNKVKYSEFQSVLYSYIIDTDLKESDVYNRVHLDRRLFSKIRTNKDYHPSKETVILLGLALELTEEKIEKLLDSAGYSLPKNNYYDLIIRYCFVKKIYDVMEVNDLLYEYKCKCFNY